MTGLLLTWVPVIGPPKSIPMVLGCLVFFFNLHTLVQCWVLPHLLHIPESWVLLFLPFLEETLFLGIPCLQSLLRCPILPQLKHLAFWCPHIIRKCFSYPSFSTIVKCFNIHCSKIHSSMGADLTFKGPRIFLHSKLAFSKAKDSISAHLASGSVTPNCTALVNLCKKSVKGSLWPCLTLIYDSVLFPSSWILSQAFKVAVLHRNKVCSL